MEQPLRPRIAAGGDGLSYVFEDTAQGPVELRRLGAARAAPDRWRALAPRLKLAAELTHDGALRVLGLELDAEVPWLLIERPHGSLLSELERGPIALDRALTTGARWRSPSRHSALRITTDQSCSADGSPL